jgi:hypothetical protein
MAAGMEGVRQVLQIGLAPVELVRDGEQHEEFIEVARSASGRDAGPTGGGGCAGGLSSERRRSSGSCFPWAVSSRLGQILASGRLAGHASTGAPICHGLPARQQDCFPAVCAQTCGSLVRNGAEPVHKQWKCWGFRCLAATMTGPLPGRARVAPCA